jgi:hypothetical protein
MLAYGWTFNAGFFNYYLAIGLSFLGLSILCGQRGLKRLYALLLAPLMLLAHPLGLVWFSGAALYTLIAERVPPRLHIFLLGSAALLLLIIHKIMWSHFKVEPAARRVYAINGMDQLVIYGNRYRILAGTLLLFVIACFICDVVEGRSEKGHWFRISLPLQLYIVAEMGVLLLPSLVYLPQYAAPVALLVERLSLVSAVLVLALLGTLRQRAWHIIGFGIFACIFFSFSYQDTSRINSMEAQVERFASNLPSGTRVMSTILRPPKSPLYMLNHIVDRACIGHCFSFSNYEPPSGQFRVRALPGNPIVTASAGDSREMEAGGYIVKSEDLPAFQIYQCTSLFTDLCLRQLEAGERNDRLGVHPGFTP